jgi:DNA repair exonuclease SbcCD ATPase subunit
MFSSKGTMEIYAEKIKLQKENIEQHKKNNEEEVVKKQAEITTNEELYSKSESDIAKIQAVVVELQKEIADELTVNQKSSKLVQLETKLESRIKKIDREISFFETNDSCPTCTQGISETFRNEQVETHNKTKIEVSNGLQEINKQIQIYNDRINDIHKINSEISNHNMEMVKLTTTMQSITKYIAKLNKEIAELNVKKETMEDGNEYLHELKNGLSSMVEEQKELITTKQYFEFASNLLKDTGIKTKIIKQYLPIMNKMINKYLTSMNFFVNFNIDENFEETIKSRFRDDFSYYNFSEGEKFRIDVALLLTWRQIARLKNSVNTNLLILDEVFDSSLDIGGTDEFMKLIGEFGHDTNVFVISHKGDQLFDKFRSVIKFEKKNNFSQVAK